MSGITNAAILLLAKRTDPLIARVNAGETLTNDESKQVFHDLYNLTSMMQTAAAAIDEATAEIDALDRDNATMKTLLGLSGDAK
jgi:hypothetical protein